MSPVIDAHQHCWQVSRPECTWPTPELSAIYRDFSPNDWQAQAKPLGVEGSVLVQSQPHERDTEYLLALADQHKSVLGVVGWVDMKAPDASAQIRALARHPKLCGVRPMLQAIEDDAWIDDPALAPAVEAMVETGLCFDALVYTRHLPYLRQFALRYPDLTVVLDHAAKPPIASGQFDQWLQAMALLAAQPNVYCKLSGLLTEAKNDQGLEHLRPWVQKLFAEFGAQRLLWGSDWPVLNLAGDYAGWVGMTRQLLAPLSASERAAIWGGTAQRVYRL